MKIPKRNMLAWMVFAAILLAILGLFVATDALKAADPSGVSVTLYKTELLADSSGTAVQVFEDTAGVPMDIVDNPGVFGSGTVPNGTYKRIKFTVKNEVTFSGPNPDAVTCSSDPATVTKSFLIDSTKGATELVPLYFATPEDGGSTGWTANGTSATPFLMQTAIAVSGGDTTVVRLIFNTAGTLQCIGGEVALLPPTMGVLSYVIEPPSSDAACTFPADYWFVHYAIRSSTTDSTGAVISNPTTTQIIENGSVVSGWGTMTFSAVDASGNGTWTVLSGGTYTVNGMAEHRHRLAQYCPHGVGTCTDTNEGYFNPALMGGDLAATYTRAGNRMILYFPEGGYIEGGMTPDCSTFVGVNVVTVDNDLVYAVRKPSLSSSHLPFDTRYMMAMPQFEIKYSETGTVPYESDVFFFGADMTVLQMGATTSADDDKMFGWRSMFQLMPDMFGTAGGEWSSQGPLERADFGKGNMDNIVSVGSNGLLSILDMDPPHEPSPEFVALGTSGSGIQAGDGQEKDTTWNNHRIYAGLIVNAALTPALSDLEGTWFISSIDARIEDGGDANGDGNVWNDNNERPEFGLSYGELTIDAAGQACGGFTYKDAFRGTIHPPEPGCVTIELRNECYECTGGYDAENNCMGFNAISSTSCGSTDGITMPVFYVISPADGGGTEIGAKFALDATKKTMVIWSPIDIAGTPYNSADGCTTSCGDASNRSQFGIGVKIQ